MQGGVPFRWGGVGAEVGIEQVGEDAVERGLLVLGRRDRSRRDRTVRQWAGVGGEVVGKVLSGDGPDHRQRIAACRFGGERASLPGGGQPGQHLVGGGAEGPVGVQGRHHRPAGQREQQDGRGEQVRVEPPVEVAAQKALRTDQQDQGEHRGGEHAEQHDRGEPSALLLPAQFLLLGGPQLLDLGEDSVTGFVHQA
ncbi:hypothetical protein [Kitasatospora sp. NPDC059800]|uniref:hypothetical protein n=1 Tax=Kitasatospora sp. NPDC059800 TaxID=3346951 RepID=UPI00365EC150